MVHGTRSYHFYFEGSWFNPGSLSSWLWIFHGFISVTSNKW